MPYDDQYQHETLMSNCECLLFDVDDTLYSRSSGLSEACTRNIEEYMSTELGLEKNEIPQLNRILYKEYGTSMAGLKAIGYDFDDDEYHSFVHGRLQYENLKPDPFLRNLLHSLPIRKVIFSNADKTHVSKVLSKLGLEDCFEQVICFETLNPKNTTPDREFNTNYASSNNEHGGGSIFPKTPIVCKPFEDAFQQAFKLANINPSRTVFFDDSTRNIETGKRMGLRTVLVGTSNQTTGADHALESIHNIKEALPDLFTASKEPKFNIHAGKVGIETSVTA
ncbi:hypothetical protein K2173_015657 [Erythroxylum novogranatense]|uniref:Uncharacterized protein n=1 Tax=Erythroxylum novogranatense TaxID=1862640 RepID=A0AAV8SE64_9ROSI|nr:hypothetical protein K2173_015657 [Erythroxylum novogranatense]